MNLTRRHVLAALPAGLAAAALARVAHAEEQPAVESSDLIYITPIRSDGSESRCQAEVWFQAHDGALYVVTAAEAWRARAVSRGLDKARVWVGDVGVWTDSDGAYRKLPSMDMRASLVTDAQAQSAVLEKMGSKYTMGWLVWGPRFRDGLADGSRVMLRYT